MRSWLLSTVFLLQAFYVCAGPDREFTRTITRDFGTLANGMTALYNKHGVVNVNTWDKNEVKINIDIVVNANSERDAGSMFNRISINFTNTPGYIKAETFVDGNSGWWPGTECQDFKINYEIWIPRENQLDLKNRYGNSFVAALNGKLTAEIRYGDLRTEVLANDADLNITYGKAVIARANNIYGQVSYGGLTVKEAKELQLDSKYSDLTIEKSAVLRLTSKNDNLRLGTLGDLRLQTKYGDVQIQTVQSAYMTGQYSDIKIQNVGVLIDADLLYGSMQISTLKRGVSDVNLVGKYADFSITTERPTNLRYDVQGTYSDMRFPNDAIVRVRKDANTQKTVDGYVGEANAKTFLKARLNYGDFVLR